MLNLVTRSIYSIDKCSPLAVHLIWNAILPLLIVLISVDVGVEAYDRLACTAVHCTCTPLVDSVLWSCDTSTPQRPTDVSVYNRIQDVVLKNYEFTNNTISILDRLDIVNFEIHACIISPKFWKSRPKYYSRTRTLGSSVMSSLSLYDIHPLPKSAVASPLFSSARPTLLRLQIIRGGPVLFGKGDFTEYKSLRVLVLRECGVRSLSPHTFIGLVLTLRHLDVTGNELHNPDVAALAGFRLRELRLLPGNRFVCNSEFSVAMDTVSTYNTSAIRECYAKHMVRTLEQEKAANYIKPQGLKGFLVWKNGFIVMLGVFLISAVLTALCYHTIRSRIQPRVLPIVVRPANY